MQYSINLQPHGFPGIILISTGLVCCMSFLCQPIREVAQGVCEVLCYLVADPHGQLTLYKIPGFPAVVKLCLERVKLRFLCICYSLFSGPFRVILSFFCRGLLLQGFRFLFPSPFGPVV